MARGLSCTAFAWSHATTIRRGGREAPSGGRATPGVGRPLNRPSCHYLRMVSSGVGLQSSSIGTSPGCFDLMGFFLFIPLRKSMSGSAFWCILSCICPYVLQNNNLPNTCGTWSVVNAYVFKFVNFSPFMS